MGNHLSCTLAAGTGSSRWAKVILPDDTIRHLQGSANAAELMLDAPGHFVVNSRSMQVGRRFSPLAADEELEKGNVYVLLAMSRVNSVVVAADAGRLLVAANKAVRRASQGRARIVPAPEPRVRLDEVEDGSVVEEFKYRLSVCRSKRPALETIAEETNESW